jgi:hypothetical protein
MFIISTKKHGKFKAENLPVAANASDPFSSTMMPDF